VTSRDSDDRRRDRTDRSGRELPPGDGARRLEELRRQVAGSIEKARTDAVALVNARYTTLRQQIATGFRNAGSAAQSRPVAQVRRLESLRLRATDILEQARVDTVALVDACFATLREHVMADFRQAIAAFHPLPSNAAGRLDDLRRTTIGRLEKARAALPAAMSTCYTRLAERVDGAVQEAAIVSGPRPKNAARQRQEFQRKPIAGIEAARTSTLTCVQARQSLLCRQVDTLFKAAAGAFTTTEEPAGNASAIPADRADQVADQLDLHGFQAEEALITLELFLQQAHAGGALRVSIIHGKGTGILRTAVRDYLPRHPLVESIEVGPHLPGDDGVTVALLHREILPSRGPAVPRTRPSARPW
jgi:DNA-nicking Smr family endonuclease